MANYQKTIYYFAKFTSVFGFAGFKLVLENMMSSKKILKFQSKENKHPIFIRKQTSDFELFFDIFVKKGYSARISKSPLVIFDLGANIGLASLYFKQCFPESKIISVEPELSNYLALLENTKSYNDITCINKAIWKSETNIEVEDLGLGKWGFMVKETIEKTSKSLESISVNKLVVDHSISRIDILKIDIEGSEKELFECNYENWLSITDLIIIELHDKMRPGASKAFFNAISPYNYQIEIKGENIFCWLNH